MTLSDIGKDEFEKVLEETDAKGKGELLMEAGCRGAI